MRPAATATNPHSRGHSWSIASVVLSLALGLLAGCSSSPPTSAGSGELLVAPTTIDPGPGPTNFETNIRLQAVVSGLEDPIALVTRPMRNQLWIAERSGRVRVVIRETEWDLTTGKVQRTGYHLEPDPVLDISQLTTTDGTRGLLSLAFSTDGQTLYLHHSGLDGALIVARYTVTDPLDYSGAPPRATEPEKKSAADPEVAADTSPPARSTTPGPIGRPAIDPATRVVLINIEHERAIQHYGGHLTLGPDGFLYISTGGIGKGIPLNAAQDPNSLQGKILRIDPTSTDGARPYSVPSDNPFASGGGAPEVWAMGLRNPWRFSFDRTNGDMWIGDTGQDQREEIDAIARDRAPGVNLGWPVREGDQPYQGSIEAGITAFSELTEPVMAYPHTEDRCAVIGGYVYRGSTVRGLDGVYIYADYCTGELRGLLSRRGAVLAEKRLNASIPPSTLNGFGQDDQGELYVLTTDGTVSVIVNA